ncbi:hypothetical protein O3X23_25770 [Streptomyces sp. H39-S7]|nr:hypothetical protein [Streptomyces sp. H39-S7]MCZ4122759.1 hypothetical protein [Streptomyces sp. H39-S7]
MTKSAPATTPPAVAAITVSDATWPPVMGAETCCPERPSHTVVVELRGRPADTSAVPVATAPSGMLQRTFTGNRSPLPPAPGTAAGASSSSTADVV